MRAATISNKTTLTPTCAVNLQAYAWPNVFSLSVTMKRESCCCYGGSVATGTAGTAPSLPE